MDSKLARQQKEAVFRAVRQLTPEQRLNAFLTHCRLVTGLYQAGAMPAAVLSLSDEFGNRVDLLLGLRGPGVAAEAGGWLRS